MKPTLHFVIGRALLGLVAMAIVIAFSSASRAQQDDDKSPPAAAEVAADDADSTEALLEPEAIAALENMGTTLRALKHFTLHSDASTDLVLDTGQKIELDGEVNYRMQQPNHLFVELKSSRRHRQIYFDGSALTVYSPDRKFYATVETKAKTLAELAINASEKFGISFPLTDLFFWSTKYAPSDVLTSAFRVGGGMIENDAVDQYAFRQESVDWQIWLSKATSLPRKIVISSLDDPARPQYQAQLRWDTAAAIDSKQFTFVAPKDADRIEFVPADSEDSTMSVSGEGK